MKSDVKKANHSVKGLAFWKAEGRRFTWGVSGFSSWNFCCGSRPVSENFFVSSFCGFLCRPRAASTWGKPCKCTPYYLCVSVFQIILFPSWTQLIPTAFILKDLSKFKVLDTQSTFYLNLLRTVTLWIPTMLWCVRVSGSCPKERTKQQSKNTRATSK